MFKQICLLILCINQLLALPTYVHNQTNQLNVSASCPNAPLCTLRQLESDYAQPLSYSDTVMPHIEQLQLIDCRMRALPVPLLNQMPNLLGLFVQNASINHMAKEDFVGLTKLKALQVNGARLSRLRQQQFVTLQQLQLLQLNDNHIEFIDAQSFEGLTQLQLLGLRDNLIEELHEGTFDALPNLLHLDLTDNALLHLHDQLFARNPKLQTLLMNNNPLAHQEPLRLMGPNNLRLLDLTHCNRVEELHLQSAHTVLVEHIQLRRIFIAGGVIRLQASNNELTQLSIGDKSSVIQLELHGNRLSGNESIALLEGMWNLHDLDLSKNEIETLAPPNNASTLFLPSLSHLNLAQNRLQSLPLATTWQAAHLHQLNISDNPMLSIRAEDFATLHSLRQLFIEGISITNLDYHWLLHSQNVPLQELAICGKGHDYRFTQLMLIYMKDYGVDVINSCVPPKPHKVSIESEQPTAAEQSSTTIGVGGIHPYWTTRDVLAVLTLLMVLIILLMQIYRILEEEGWLLRFRQWLLCRQPAVITGRRPRRLNAEDDSESSSD